MKYSIQFLNLGFLAVCFLSTTLLGTSCNSGKAESNALGHTVSYNIWTDNCGILPIELWLNGTKLSGTVHNCDTKHTKGCGNTGWGFRLGVGHHRFNAKAGSRTWSWNKTITGSSSGCYSMLLSTRD